MKRVAQKRDSYFLNEQAELAQELDAFRSEPGRNRSWRKAFLSEKWGLDLGSGSTQYESKRRLNQIRGALQGNREMKVAPRGPRRGVRTVPAGKRKRDYGGGRRCTHEELKEELWYWFVNELRVCKKRIDMTSLTNEAN